MLDTTEFDAAVREIMATRSIGYGAALDVVRDLRPKLWAPIAAAYKREAPAATSLRGSVGPVRASYTAQSEPGDAEREAQLDALVEQTMERRQLGYGAALDIVRTERPDLWQPIAGRYRS